jgi:hypothetical protein
MRSRYIPKVHGTKHGAFQVGTVGRDSEIIDRPGNHQLGSIESRTAARAMLERIRTSQKRKVIVDRIEHIGHDGKEPLPLPRIRVERL